MNRRKIAKERQNYGIQEVSSGAAQDKGKQGELSTKGMDKGKPKFTTTHSKIKEGETAKLKVAPSRINEGEVGAEGVNKPGLKETSSQSNLKQGDVTPKGPKKKRNCIEGHPSPKRMKKAVPKKLDFSHLRSTFDAISRRVNTLPPTVGEQQSIPPEQPTCSMSKDASKNQGPQPPCNEQPTLPAMPNSDSTHRDATEALQRNLDSIRKRNKIVQSTSVTQQRSSGAFAQITGEQSLQNNAQVAQESIQERQQDFPLPTADSRPENEANLMDQDGPELQKGRPVLRATTIDEFLKENGADVDLDDM
ncbi:hypothetical protein PIB30_076897 [Stylosanthes scabra]|uniref:Uncharacterized protein n=1 Tax=Stylosanthes scabra TaxID=79078 RepID=A0ABU6VQP2_9FABA|nr:hypothetical protein [Stylosanthes scabra]